MADGHEEQFLDFEKLMDHCQSGNVYDVEGFISSFGSEAVVMATDENNWTGLHYAAYLGDAGVVRLLLQHGADPNAKENYQRTPMSIAASKDRSDVIAILVDAGADVEDPPGRALGVTIRDSAKKAARELLRRGASLQKAIEWGSDGLAQHTFADNFPGRLKKNLGHLVTSIVETLKEEKTLTKFEESDLKEIEETLGTKGLALACLQSAAFVSVFDSHDSILPSTPLSVAIDLLDPHEELACQMIHHLVSCSYWDPTKSMAEILTNELNNIPKPDVELFSSSFQFLLRFDPDLKHFVYKLFEANLRVIEFVPADIIDNAVDSNGNTLMDLATGKRFAEGVDALIRLGVNPHGMDEGKSVLDTMHSNH